MLVFLPHVVNGACSPIVPAGLANPADGPVCKKCGLMPLKFRLLSGIAAPFQHSGSRVSLYPGM